MPHSPIHFFLLRFLTFVSILPKDVWHADCHSQGSNCQPAVTQQVEQLGLTFLCATPKKG